MFPVLKGTITVGGVMHDAFHTLVLSNNANETGISMTASQEGTEVVVVSNVATCPRHQVSQ